MQPHRKLTLALSVFVPVLALLGCQKASDTAPPAASVAGPGGEKADPQSNSAAETPEPKPETDLQHPIFAIDTTAGKITVRLDAEKARLTVDNFRMYAARGHYDSTIFHQVVKQPVQIVLGGVYTADLKDKPASTPIRSEADNGLKNTRGTIAMLRRSDDEDSATCQFFFNISDNELLNYKMRPPEDKLKPRKPDDYGYCVFGEVIDGMEILDRIAKGPVHTAGNHPDMPDEIVAIKTVQQIR